MITPLDTALILAKIAAYDQRTTGDTDVAAWTEALRLAKPTINRDDALVAVTRWHAENDEGRIRPAHVIRGAQDEAKRRAYRARRAELDKQFAIEAAETVDRTPEIVEARQRLAEGMGMGDRDVLHPRQAAWERKQRLSAMAGRERSDEVTNPLFRGYPPDGGIPFPGDPAMA